MKAPEYESFNIRWLYEYLDDGWLEFALELMVQFFQEDTYLIQKPTLSILRESGENYFNQKQFADFLSENGLHYDKRKLNVYYSRGKLPKADIELAGTPYWSKYTVEGFLRAGEKPFKKGIS